MTATAQAAMAYETKQECICTILEAEYMKQAEGEKFWFDANSTLKTLVPSQSPFPSTYHLSVC